MVGDRAAFKVAWQRADTFVLRQIANPAISLIGEITRWVADEVERIAAGTTRRWLNEIGSHSLVVIHEFVRAAEDRDGARAFAVWNDDLEASDECIERGEIADLPLTALVDGRAQDGRSPGGPLDAVVCAHVMELENARPRVPSRPTCSRARRVRGS